MRLDWDISGTRHYEKGLDQGVLYLPDGSGVPWSGLTSVDEDASGDTTEPLYFDGVKFADVPLIGDYEATLKAFTFPDEFLQFEGVIDLGNGIFVGNQNLDRFGLTYRTRVASDLDSDLAYKVHVVYNLMAVPDSRGYSTHSGTVDLNEFGWSLSAVPVGITGYRPTAHIKFDSRYLDPALLAEFEDILYGTAITSARLPTIAELIALTV